MLNSMNMKLTISAAIIVVVAVLVCAAAFVGLMWFREKQAA